MPNEIRLKDIARATFTITLASLANLSARQSTMISNPNDYPSANITLQIRSGGVAPTAGTVYEVYLIRGDGVERDDNAGATDATIVIENATLLGTIVVTANTAKDFTKSFDTTPAGPLGIEWGIAVRNASGQALDATEANHVKGYQYFVPEIQ